MNNQTLFQIVQQAGGMHLLYNNDVEQVRAIAQAAFEAGKQAAAVQDVLDMSDSRNWQVGDVVRRKSDDCRHSVVSKDNYGVTLNGMGLSIMHSAASEAFAWLRHATKESAK